jgi:hypothetical protein
MREPRAARLERTNRPGPTKGSGSDREPTSSRSAGTRFENSKLVERPDESGGEVQVANTLIHVLTISRQLVTNDGTGLLTGPTSRTV